jgi:Phage ABA sandwich domain
MSREIDYLVATKVLGWNYSTREEYHHFRPSEILDHAWRVVDELKIAIIPQSGGAPKELKYFAEIDNRPLGNHYEAFAATAPMVICKVALKWAEGEGK